MKDFVCFFHILKHYSLLHLSLALKSLKYSLISSLSIGSHFPICTTYPVRFALQTKIRTYLLRKSFETLQSDRFCVLYPFEVLHHLYLLGLHFNCTKCLQKWL